MFSPGIIGEICMTQLCNGNKIKIFIWACLISLCLITVTGCKAREKFFTIGVASNITLDAPVWQGFTQGMSELGYIEGKNMKFIIKQIPENTQQDLDTVIKELMNQNVDLFLPLGREVEMRARELIKGNNNIPVLFATTLGPISTGLVKSISHPGGNFTGLQGVDCVPKALETLKVIS
jgi:ABC-type uncharacterized transport system substrate-binding protein